jgi:hypothetical protein
MLFSAMFEVLFAGKRPASDTPAGPISIIHNARGNLHVAAVCYDNNVIGVQIAGDFRQLQPGHPNVTEGDTVTGVIRD